MLEIESIDLLKKEREKIAEKVKEFGELVAECMEDCLDDYNRDILETIYATTVELESDLIRLDNLCEEEEEEFDQYADDMKNPYGEQNC